MSNKKAKKRVLEKWAQKLKLSEEGKRDLQEILDCLNMKHAACYFIIQDLKKEVSPAIICERYGVTPDELRGIGQRAGIYKLRPRQINGV